MPPKTHPNDEPIPVEPVTPPHGVTEEAPVPTEKTAEAVAAEYGS